MRPMTHIWRISRMRKVFATKLISITNDNSMFKQQALYLVKQRQPELLAEALMITCIAANSSTR